MSLAATLDRPLYTGRGTTTLVPMVFDVALDGHAFMVDEQHDLNGFRGAYYRRVTVPVLRQQADTSNRPGEQSISPEGLWRRAQETWIGGAGQLYVDRVAGDPTRFHASKGVNPWNRWQLSLLPDTSVARASANGTLPMVTAGTVLYVGDGNSLLRSTDLSAFTAVTGTPASGCVSLATDGFNVWAAFGANGLYGTTRGAAAATSFSAQACTLVRFVNGRLVIANANVLYTVGGTGTATALITHANTDWAWTAVAQTPGFMLLAGWSGSYSAVYKTNLQSDGATFNAPTIAAELPVGETVLSMTGYLGYVVLGTSLGVRFCAVDINTGNLTLGSLIPTPAAVRCCSGQDRFVWFGWSNYDSVSTGLGRLDLSTFTNALTPAYASDLMATAQGEVLATTVVGTTRLFSVSGAGFYKQSANLVASGTLTSGLISYGMPDNKVAMMVDIRHAPLAGSVGVALATNQAAAVSLGTSSAQGSVGASGPFTAGQVYGEAFEITLTLSRSGTAPTTGPTVNRSTLYAYPAPPRATQFVIPLLFADRIKARNGGIYPMDCQQELDAILALQDTQRVITYQEGTGNYQVYVDGTEYVPIERTTTGNFWEGTLVLTLKEALP